MVNLPTRDAIELVVSNFYDDVRNDDLLSPIFDSKLGGNWDAHVERLVQFWCNIILGTNEYKGSVYRKHMEISGVTKEHFVRWLQLFERNASSQFSDEVCSEVMQVANRIATSLQYGMLSEM